MLTKQRNIVKSDAKKKKIPPANEFLLFFGIDLFCSRKQTQNLLGILTPVSKSLDNDVPVSHVGW